MISNRRAAIVGRIGYFAGVLALAMMAALLSKMALILVGDVRTFPLLASTVVRNHASQLKPALWKSPYDVVAVVLLLLAAGASIITTCAAAIWRAQGSSVKS